MTSPVHDLLRVLGVRAASIHTASRSPGVSARRSACTGRRVRRDAADWTWLFLSERKPAGAWTAMVRSAPDQPVDGEERQPRRSVLCLLDRRDELLTGEYLELLL